MSRAQRVDLEALERLDKEAARAPWVHGGSLVRDCDSRIIGEFENYVGTAFVVHMRNRLGAIIAELKAGRALVNDLEGAIVYTIEAEASRVLVRSALRGFREATKVEG